MNPKYHGYFCPEACRSLREWLFRYWHDFYAAHGGRGVVEERGIQVLGCYFIWQRMLKEEPTVEEQLREEIAQLEAAIDDCPCESWHFPHMPGTPAP